MTRSFLTVGDILALQTDQIREFGGSEGVLDERGLESAVMYGALRGRDRSLLAPAAAHFLTWQVLGSL